MLVERPGLDLARRRRRVEPSSPLSSAPHHAKRSVFSGFSFEICWAISSSAAEPLPLSLMPGPACTESRCAPAITTLSSFVPGSSAMTLTCGRDSGAVDHDVRRRAGLREGCAVGEARADDRDGQRRLVDAEERAGDRGPRAVGRVALVEDDDRLGAGRLGVDRLDAERRRCRAGSARCRRARQSSPAKSAASQPLVTGSRGGSRLMSTGITLPVTSP